MKKILFLVSLSFLFISLASSEDYRYFKEPNPLVQKKIEKWQDLKFGLLMHWGTYSQWGIVESWSLSPEDYGWCKRDKGKNPKNYFEYKKEYEDLIKTFNPHKFNPEKWAKAAKDAGMKYMIFTTKHHDGFCMFDTKYTDYKITSKNCPFSKNKRANITKELFNAFRKEGLWVGAYFSKPDWHSEYYWNPYFPPFDRNVNYDPEVYPQLWNKFVRFTHNQIMELMTEYGKIDILWLDGGWVQKRSQKDIENYYKNAFKESKTGFIKHREVSQDIKMDELVKKVRKVQPDIIIVDRAVAGKNQNYLTPEKSIPEDIIPYPWETCMPMSQSWSYVKNPKYKTPEELIHILIDIVSKGGNLLLNIGPSPEGEWDKKAYENLKEIGKWLKENGEAIYGTRPYKIYGYENIRFTKKRETIYIFYLKNDKENPEKIILKNLFDKHPEFYTLNGEKLKSKYSENKIIIKLSLKKTKYAIVLKTKI